MKSNSRRALQIILASILFLMGCDVSTFALSQQIPTPNPDVVHLMVVQTAAAAAAETASFIPPTLTSTLTPFPTQTPVNTPTITPTYIFLLATSTSASSGTACDDATFVSDLTIPDHTIENPGEFFVKTWVLQNTGSCTWGSGYTLNFVRGTQMGGKNTNVGSLVAPGEQAQISVTMTAPTTAGEYTGSWRLNNAAGKSFGEMVDVLVDVNEDGYTQTPTSVATTAVPPTSGPTTAVPPTSIPTTAVPPTSVPTTAVPPTSIPTTALPPAAVPTTAVPPKSTP